MPCLKASEPSSSNRACAIHVSIVVASTLFASSHTVQQDDSSNSLVLHEDEVENADNTVTIDIHCRTCGHSFTQLLCNKNQIQNAHNVHRDSRPRRTSRSFTYDNVNFTGVPQE